MSVETVDTIVEKISPPIAQQPLGHISLKEIEQLPFLKEISNFIFATKYARYNEELQRRETWEEAVTRVESMHLRRFSNRLSAEQMAKVRWAFDLVRMKRVVPSMRSMQFGGMAVEAHEARIYNCACRHIDSLRSFAEGFYLLLCGTGVTFGFSKKYMNRLPNLVSKTNKTGTVITYVVEDTIEGWADSVEALLMCYFKNTPYTGRKIVFDYSKIRRKGTKLKTSGGKAPGHEGLKNAHNKIKRLLDYVIEHDHQTRLSSINAYDILMHCADAVLSGGVRRAATMAIFDIDDIQMMDSKVNFSILRHSPFEKNEKGKWEGWVTVDARRGSGYEGMRYNVELTDWEYEMVKNGTIPWMHIEPQRARSNNSVRLIRTKTTLEDFVRIVERTRQWGEPGFIFADNDDVLVNPCAEIGFMPVTDSGVCGVQFCNLTSMNGVMIKSIEDYFQCVEAATIIGTLQADYTDFPYLSNTARELTEDEALLGVSMTGIMDSPDILLNPRNQFLAAQLAVRTNKEWAKTLGIKQAARVTCVKPEGTSSLVLESASGIHPHHAYRYFRRVFMNKLDPVYQYFKAHNPHMIEESVYSENKTDDVITFLVEVPKNCKVKDDFSAIEHLDIIKSTQENWVKTGTTEANKKNIHHNVSATVSVKEEEWGELTQYLFNNKDYFTALSFLPNVSDKLYKQAVWERVATDEDERKWNEILEKFVPVDYTQLIESEDHTELAENLACVGGACTI